MKEYQVTPAFKLTIDRELNWRVLEFVKGSYQTKGFSKGKTTEDRWDLLEKYWPHCIQALNYIQKRELVSSEEACTIGDIIEDYKLMYENAEESFKVIEKNL